MFCKNCGQPVGENAIFCTNCGTKLSSTEKTFQQQEINNQNENFSPKSSVNGVQVEKEGSFTEYMEASENGFSMHVTEAMEGKKKIIIGSIVAALVLFMGIGITIPLVHRNKFQKTVAAFANISDKYALGNLESDYKELQEQSQEILESNSFGDMGTQKEKIHQLEEKIQSYNEENQKKYQTLAQEFKNLSREYVIGTYQNSYDQLLEKSSQEKVEKDYIQIESLLQEMDTLKNDIVAMNQQVAEYREAHTAIKDDFQKLYAQDGQKENYKKLLTELEKALESFDVESCDLAVTELQNYVAKLTEENIQEISQLEKNIKSGNFSGMLDVERKLFHTMQTNAEEALSNENYKKAYKQYQKCAEILQVASKSQNYHMNLEQVDVSEYPMIKLYISIYDKVQQTYVENLQETGFTLMESTNQGGKWEETAIKRAVKMDGQEGLSIGLVADCSASMEDNFGLAQNVMSQFVGNLQVGVGDMAALYAFSDMVTRSQYFTNDISSLQHSIGNLEMGNMTALYDGLAFALSEIVVKDGAKCIIAFTDGMENASHSSKEYVISKAQEYHVPIYLIGIAGSVDSSELREIAESTGGFYENVQSASYIGNIYQRIYREHKSMYVVQYQTNKAAEDIQRSVYINYKDSNYGIHMENVYTPAEYKLNNFIFWDSDKRYITEAELEPLTEAEIRIARNEIYARRGYKFTFQDMIQHFNSCSWYTATEESMEVVASQFNEYEKKNILLLVNYEAKHGLNGAVQ